MIAPPGPSLLRHCRGPSGWLLWIDVHVRGVSEETDPLLLLPLLCHLHREKERISDGVRCVTPTGPQKQTLLQQASEVTKLAQDITPQRQPAPV